LNASPPSAEQIAAARWYGGKGGAITSVDELDRLELGTGACLRVLDVGTRDGGADRYLWLEGDVGAALVALVAAGGERGAFRFEPGDGLEPVTGERAIGHDQSNTSIVVGERVVAKIYRRIEAGTHPEIELGASLTAMGLDCVSAFRGAGFWNGHPLVLVQDYVADAVDGWTWATSAVREGDPSLAAAVGAVVSRLERALGELGTAPATAAQSAAWADAAELQLARAIELVSGPSHSLLIDNADGIRLQLERLRHPTPPPLVSRVHGDLHIGQVLRAPDGRLLVVDFEGEPARSLAERTSAGPPLRDVAAMLRSFDHVARFVVSDSWPGHLAAAEVWIDHAREAFLGEYGAVDRGLLHAFEVEKECYEFTYAATYLPEWMPVADGGMRWLLEHPHE
jgi:maltokinase